MIINIVSMPTKEHRENRVDKKPQKCSAQLFPRSTQEPSGHQAIKGSSSQAQRSTGRHSGKWNSKFRTQRKRHPVQAPPRSVPRDLQPHVQAWTHQEESRGKVLQNTFWTNEGCCLGVWQPYKMQRKFFGIAQDSLWEV